MEELRKYAEAFTHLHTATVKGHKAPHKAILLLSIIDLIETKAICTPRVELTDELIRKFHHVWMRYIGDSTIFRPKIEQPYFHMQYEPFWILVEKRHSQTRLVAEGEPSYKGISMRKELPQGGYSLKAMRSAFEYAQIDNCLFELLQNADVRALLRVLLINTYLTNQPTFTLPDFSKIILALSFMLLAA